MNNREKMHKILDLTLDIVEHEKGENGYPMIALEFSNFPQCMYLRSMENGFLHGYKYDESNFYKFDSDKLDDVIAYLEKILEKATAYIQEVDE